MAIQFLRGTAAANDGYTGPLGSLSIDTDNNNIRLHDGSTAGGHVIANIDSTGNVESVTGNSPIVISGTTANPVVTINAATQSQDGYLSSEDKTKLDGVESGAQVNTVTSVDGNTGAVDLSADYEPKRQHNIGTTDPTVNDDSGAGYEVFSKWVNTSSNTIYVCLDATAGAAVWEKSNLELDDLGSAATYDVGTGSGQLLTGSSIAATYAPLDSPTFTGTVTIDQGVI